MFETISVIVPCYNEGNSIKEKMLELSHFLNILSQNKKCTYEIVAVNDGSKDDTLDKLNEIRKIINNFKVIDYGANKGKGYAVKKGIESANGDFICFTDADLSTPPEEIVRAIEKMEYNNSEIIIGSRSIKGSNVENKQPFYRVFMGRVFSFLANSIVPVGHISDTQCGFKCFTKKATKEIFPLQTMERFSFDVELLYIAKLKGYKVVEMPVTWINDETSTVNPIRDSIRMFKDLWVIRFRHKKDRR